VKDLLVLTYVFPPSSVTGVHRPLAFVKYLEPLGWRSTVLCAENPWFPQRDESLVAQIPPGTRIVRTTDDYLLAMLQRQRWWPRGNRANGNSSTTTADRSKGSKPRRSLREVLLDYLHPVYRWPGWPLPTVRAGRRILRERSIDAIYSTAPPWDAHMVAYRLAREFGTPWIADFRDPWTANPFGDIPFESVRRRNVKHEAMVLAKADLILCVLETIREDLLARYPERSPESVVTISNGFDPENLVGLGGGATFERGSPDPSLTILHAGHVYGRRRIEPFLTGMVEWLRAEPALAAVARGCLLGGAPQGAAELRAKIAAAGATQWIDAQPEVSHREALERMARASILLLIGFSGPGEQFQMSGKIFEYLALRRPILALAPPSCPVGAVLRESGVRHWIVSPDDGAGLQGALRQIGEAWRLGQLEGPQSTASLAAFDRREQTKRLAEILNHVTRPKQRMAALTV